MKILHFLLISFVLYCQLLFFSFSVFGQKEGHNWYFGNQAGITFNSGSAVAVTNSQMNTPRGCATVSDSLGNLLFYTDGATVWDKNHQVMQNGSGLAGSPSMSQSAVIVPHPGKRYQYYVFTLSNKGTGDADRAALSFSIVDMSLNGGLGAVDKDYKNILYIRHMPVNGGGSFRYRLFSQKMTVVPHANGREYWLILQFGSKFTDQNNLSYPYNEWSSRQYNAFLIPCKTIEYTYSSFPELGGNIKVTQNIDVNRSIIGTVTGESYGQLAVSPVISGEYRYLAAASGTTGISITKINLTTGNIFLVFQYGELNAIKNGVNGVEFSPDGSKIFCTQDWGSVGELWECKVHEHLKTKIASNLKKPSGLLRGPDGKIYIAQDGHNYLGVVNNPNGWGTSQVNFQKDGFYLGGRTSYKGLPTRVVPNIGHFDMDISGINGESCGGVDKQVTFTYKGRPLSELGSSATVTWNFGEGGASSTATTITHTYNSYGTKTVKLIRNDGVCIDTITKNIVIKPSNSGSESFIKHPPITICQGDSITLRPQGTQYDYNLYNWRTGYLYHDPILVTECIRDLSGECYKYPPGAYNLPSNPNVSNYVNPYKNDSLVVYETDSYKLTIYEPIGSNLITNGQFEAGNMGFTSEYTYKNYGTALTTSSHSVPTLGVIGSRGSYTVGSNPSLGNSSYQNCVDRSGTPDGKMLIVRGDCYTKYAHTTAEIGLIRASTKVVWKQTVTGLSPSTTYIFSVWVARTATSNNINPPINIKVFGVGNGVSSWITGETCEWKKITYLFRTSSSQTSVNLSIAESSGVQYMCNGSNRGFAIDQIELYKACSYIQQFDVYVKPKPSVSAVAVAETCTGLAVGEANATPSGGTPPYTLGWSNGEVGTTATNLPEGINTVTVNDQFCSKTTTVNIESLNQPSLQINETNCNNTTYDVEVLYNAIDITSSIGTIVGSSVVGIPTNTDVTITASNGNCEATAIVVPPPCPVPPTCELPSLITNAGVCDGLYTETYSVSFFVTPSNTPITVSAGTINGSFISGIPIGTDVTITAGSGACEVSVTRISPQGCSDPCLMDEMFVVKGTECYGSGYTINFTPLVANLNFTVSAGVLDIDGNRIINIPQGTNVTLTATHLMCTDYLQTETISSPSCVPCVEPQLIISPPSMCGVGTYSIYVYSDGTITTSVGTVIGDSIVGIPLQANVVVTATNGNCSISSTVEGLNICSPSSNCILPNLTTSGAVCNGTTYSVAFNVDPQITVTASAGTVGNGVVTGIPIGTDVILSAGSGDCAVSVTRNSPIECDYPCLSPTPLISVGGASCFGSTYSVHFIVAPSTTVVPSVGILNGNSVTNIPQGTNVTLTATASCGTQTVDVNSPSYCVPCTEPQLILNAATECSNGFYSVYVGTGGTISASVGDIVGDSIVNIPIGTNVVVTATDGNCSVSGTAISPTSCPDPSNCILPSLTTSNAICDGAGTYSVAFTVDPPTTIVFPSIGSVNNGVVTGIPIGQNVTLTAINGSCIASVIRTSPANCVDPCVTGSLVGVSGVECVGTTYTLHFYTATGTTVTASAGQVSGNSVINIPQGTNVTLTANQ